jgi:hypothetical protein
MKGASNRGRSSPLLILIPSTGVMTADSSEHSHPASSSSNEGKPEEDESDDKTTEDASQEQVLFEEGGGGAGFNLYIRGGKVYAGAWGVA